MPRSSHSRVWLSFCVPTVLMIHGAGISTCCPSATSFDLTLGPDLPRADQLYSGNLGFSAERFLAALSLLMPASSLPCRPPGLAPPASPGMESSPTNQVHDSAASAPCLSPAHCRRAPTRPVSCYALFECMAASKPTSWLSGRAHILCHLARPLGPWRAVWAVSLSSAQLSPRALTPGVQTIGIRSLVWVGRR